jgi:hypothetical protein
MFSCMILPADQHPSSLQCHAARPTCDRLLKALGPGEREGEGEARGRGRRGRVALQAPQPGLAQLRVVLDRHVNVQQHCAWGGKQALAIGHVR